MTSHSAIHGLADPPLSMAIVNAPTVVGVTAVSWRLFQWKTILMKEYYLRTHALFWDNFLLCLLVLKDPSSFKGFDSWFSKVNMSLWNHPYGVCTWVLGVLAYSIELVSRDSCTHQKLCCLSFDKPFFCWSRLLNDMATNIPNFSSNRKRPL